MLPGSIYHNPRADLINTFEKFPMLSREEEFGLAIRFLEQGDRDAAHCLITANLRNVVHIALGYSGYKMPLEDIVQEGALGLMMAVKKFDPHKGYRLMTYAVWWIKAMIHEYIIRFYSLVRLGTTKLQKKLFYGLNRMMIEERAMQNSTAEWHRALSARLEADPHQVEEFVSRLKSNDQSLNSVLHDESGNSFMDFLMDTRSSPEHQMMEFQRLTFVKNQVDTALLKLTPREREIARGRLMTDKRQTLADLGKQYAISKERVRQIENSVKVKLRDAMAEHAGFML